VQLALSAPAKELPSPAAQKAKRAKQE
jgi:hypothetical protein